MLQENVKINDIPDESNIIELNLISKPNWF